MPESQISKIIQTSQDVFDLPAFDAGELAFMSKSFIQATLPHSDPGEIPIWYRQSGNYTLTIQPYLSPKDGKIRNFGIPYGSIPRLILAWANAETVRTKSQELVLGNSLADFMGKIGIEVSGGPRGGITRLKNQAIRLFSARISMSYEDSRGIAISDTRIAKQSFFFWDSKQPMQKSLWESKVVLSEDFYKILLESPVPLDFRILKSLKHSPMALDLYMWLSYRSFKLNKTQKIKWELLSLQFGAGYKSMTGFRQNFRKHLKKVKAIWQDLNIDVEHEEYITLAPSRPLINPKSNNLLPVDKSVENSSYLR